MHATVRYFFQAMGGYALGKGRFMQYKSLQALRYDSSTARTPKLPYGKVQKRREADIKKYQFNGGFTEKLKRVIVQKRVQGAKLS